MPSEIVVAYLLVFCRIAVGLAFLTSSISKVSNIRQFRQTIITFHILPHQYIAIVALFLICMEALVALSMIVGSIFLFPGFFLAIILLSLFSMALLSVLARKIAVSCNCFSPSNKPVTGFDILRNVGFIVSALTGDWIAFRTEQTNYLLTIPEWITVGLSAVVFALIWMKLGDIMQFLLQEG